MRTSELSLSVLGGVSVQVATRRLSLSRSERQMVAILAVAGPEGLSPDVLADRLWGMDIPPSWAASLRNSIARINKKVDKVDAGMKLISEPRNGRRLLEVEAENVDLWRLRNATEGDVFATAQLDLLAGDPFDDCELGDALRSPAADIWRMRAGVILRALRAQAEIPKSRYSDILAVGRECSHDDELIDGIEDLTGEQLRTAELTASQTNVIPVASAQRRSQKVASLCKPPGLRPESEIDDLAVRLVRKDAPGLLLYGERGIGKTCLAARVAARLENHGFHSAYIIAMEEPIQPSEPFRAFITGVQGLRSSSELAEPRETGDLGRLRNGILEYLERTYSGRPLCLVVDNAQWLDVPSQELVRTIAAADLDLEVSIIAVGNPGTEDPLWPQWQSDLERAWLEPVAVNPLDLSAIARLVTDKFPNVEDVAAHQLAERILESSSGIPLVAAKLADSVNENTLDFEIENSAASGFETMLTSLDPLLVEVGGTAAALGMEVTVDDVATAGAFKTDLVRTSLLNLADEGFLDAQPQPDRFMFPHVMMADAFVDRLKIKRRVEIHQTAFDAAVDLPTKTHHAVRLRAFGQGLEASDFARLLATYGSELEASDQHFRAMKAFENALEASREDVTFGERVSYANSCSRVGVPVTDTLWELAGDLIEAGELDLAVTAATVGLPEMEKLWGDEERVGIFRLIDPAKLSHESRIVWLTQLSRQLFLLGDRQGAAALADQAFTMAKTTDERADAWLAKCRSSGWTLLEPAADPEWLSNASPSRVATIQQAMTISNLSNGQSRDCYSEILQQRAYADAKGLTTLSFYAKTFQATALVDIGQFDQAATVAAESMQTGRRHGLSVANDAFQTQQFLWQFHQRRHGALWKLISDSPNTDGNIIYQIAASAARYAHNLSRPRQRREAVADALMVCELAKETQYATIAAAIFAPQIYESQRKSMMNWAVDVLHPFEDHYILVASAIANLGPCRAILAELEGPGRTKIDLLQAATDQADEDSLPLWQVACRVEMANAQATEENATPWLEDARIHAHTSWLQQVLEGRRAFGQNKLGKPSEK